MRLHTFMLALNLLSPPQVSEALAARLLPVLPLSQCAARLHLRVFYSARGLNTVCILSTFTNNTTMTSPHPKCTRDANKSYFENALIQYLVRSEDGRTSAAMGICSYREKKDKKTMNLQRRKTFPEQPKDWFVYICSSVHPPVSPKRNLPFGTRLLLLSIFGCCRYCF